MMQYFVDNVFLWCSPLTYDTFITHLIYYIGVFQASIHYMQRYCCDEPISSKQPNWLLTSQIPRTLFIPWWRHQMETFSALLAICAGNSPVPGEFPTQRPVTQSFDVYFDLRPDKRLSKQSWGWWFETLSHSLWRHRNVRSARYGCCVTSLSTHS